MQTIKRLDRGSLQTPKETPNGWFRFDGRFTRTGVFEYRIDASTTRKEYRPPEEVFNEDSLASFRGVPITNQHPEDFLTGENTKDFSCGAVESPRRDGEFVVGSGLITESKLIEIIKRKDAVQLSCGYTCEFDPTPGVAPSGERYDGIQRNIRGNHLAVVPRGRAGPMARIVMDGAQVEIDNSSADPLPSEKSTQPKDQKMNKIRIDGIDYDAASDSASQAMARYEQKKTDEAKDFKTRLDSMAAEQEKLRAKADELLATMVKKDAELAAMPAKVSAELKLRADLEEKAASVLPDEKFDGLDDKALRLKVLASIHPDQKFDQHPDAYIEARFDAAIESHSDASPIDAVTEKIDGEENEDEEGSPKPRKDAIDSVSARARMIKDHDDMWKKTINRSA